MPHLYKSKFHGWRVKYRIWFPDGTHIDKTKHRTRKIDAERMLTEVDRLESLSRKAALSKKEITFFVNMEYLTPNEATLLAGAFISPYRTWNELAIKYEDWSRSNCRAYTHLCNTSKLKGVLDAFADISLAEVSKDNIERFISKRKKEVQNDTICKELIILRKLLDYIDEDNNPARKIHMPKVIGRKKRPLSAIEMQAFFEKLEQNKRLYYGLLKPFVMFYLYAGMRPSEIARLKKSDIRLDIKKIIVEGETKTMEARSIDIHPELMPTLQDLLNRTTNAQGLFGRKIDAKNISRLISLTMGLAGLQGMSSYSLRHSFISYLLKHTRDLAYVMRQAGHKQIKTTQGYIDVIEDPDSPINKLDFGLKTTTPKNTPTPQKTPQ